MPFRMNFCLFSFVLFASGFISICFAGRFSPGRAARSVDTGLADDLSRKYSDSRNDCCDLFRRHAAYPENGGKCGDKTDDGGPELPARQLLFPVDVHILNSFL